MWVAPNAFARAMMCAFVFAGLEDRPYAWMALWRSPVFRIG